MSASRLPDWLAFLLVVFALVIVPAFVSTAVHS